MRWLVPLLIVTAAAVSVSAMAQLTPGGPSGDFRIDDRPGHAPTGGPPGGTSLPANPMTFRDIIGGKPPDEVLKRIDKDLGRSTLERSDQSSSSFDRGRDLWSPSDKSR